jgi:hypothetical protein
MPRLLLLVLALAACARGSAAPAGGGAAAGADTLRGTLRITGSEPGVTFVVVDASGRTTALDGDRVLLERLAGVEVAVEGDAVADAPFRVARVAVRAVEGVAAVDGVLAREGGRDVLVLADGTRRVVARLPEPLRGRTGARVWLAGPLDSDIDSFGVISGPR